MYENRAAPINCIDGSIVRIQPRQAETTFRGRDATRSLNGVFDASRVQEEALAEERRVLRQDIEVRRCLCSS